MLAQAFQELAKYLTHPGFSSPNLEAPPILASRNDTDD